jgi:hypothetical protein
MKLKKIPLTSGKNIRAFAPDFLRRNPEEIYSDLAAPVSSAWMEDYLTGRFMTNKEK